MKTIKSKKAEGGAFGLSFGMIFSIILIIFFILVAFFAIKYFLSWQKCTNLHLLFSDVSEDIEKAFYSTGFIGNKTYNSAGIEYVCFVNLTASPKEASVKEISIYENIKTEGYLTSDNVFLYAPNKELCAKSAKIRFVDLSQKNPICIKVINNKVTIRLERKEEYKAVKVSA